MDSEEKGKNKNKSLNKHLICLTKIKMDRFHGNKWEIYCRENYKGFMKKI